MKKLTEQKIFGQGQNDLGTPDWLIQSAKAARKHDSGVDIQRG